MKTLFNHVILILICIVLFILYIVIDRKNYNRENFKLNDEFILVGNPNDNESAVFAYEDVVESINQSVQDNSLNSFLDVFPGLDLQYDNMDNAQAIYDTIRNKGNNKFFRDHSIIQDLKYFNNASHLIDANRTNTLS